MVPQSRYYCLKSGKLALTVSNLNFNTNSLRQTYSLKSKQSRYPKIRDLWLRSVPLFNAFPFPISQLASVYYKILGLVVNCALPIDSSAYISLEMNDTRHTYPGLPSIPVLLAYQYGNIMAKA